MKRLILIDLSGLFWASWHATADQEVSAAYERTLNKVASLREGFDLCAICCDAPPYRRKELSPEYKAQRDAPPPQALEQFDRVKKRLEADGLLLWAAKGYEADDVIATACRFAEADELDVTIASSDKDLLALVDDAAHVRVLSIASGQLFGSAAVVEKFGVVPKLIPDLLALMGDTSDNVPGIPRVGVKTAAGLLQQFGTAQDVVDGASDIETEKLRQAVQEHGHRVPLALRLVTLENDAPIKWEELYQERQPKVISGGMDWIEADFEEEKPVAATQKVEEPKGEPEQARPPEERAKTITAIVRAPAEWSLALEPPTARDAYIVAQKLYDSRLFGNFSSPQAIFAVILRGRALGLDATTALANFHVIEGRPAMHAGLVIGLVLKSGKAEYFDLVETTRERASWVTKRKGSAREIKLTWTIEDALAAELVEKVGNEYRGRSRSGKPSNWDKYRRTMLRWRCGVELARAVYPDLCAGLYTPDEVSDGEADVGDAELEVA